MNGSGDDLESAVRRRKEVEAELKRLHDEVEFQRLRVFKATMRTVQGIVNDLLNSLHLVHVETESELPAGMLAMVDRIIRERLEDGQFDECDLTLRDLEHVREAFVAQLLGMYHRRVEYPQNKIVEIESRRASGRTG